MVNHVVDHGKWLHNHWAWSYMNLSGTIKVKISSKYISPSLWLPPYLAPKLGHQVQRKAESEQSFVRPEIEERLQKAKLEAGLRAADGVTHPTDSKRNYRRFFNEDVIVIHDINIR